MSTPPPKAAIVILDSSERTVIEQGIEEGWLPNLKAFRERGAWALLDSPGDDINASPWPSFVSGKTTADHGVWNFLAWDAQKMDHAPCDPANQNFHPWWRDLSDAGHRCLVLDIPRAYAPEKAFDGVELGSWASHYKLCPPFANPPSFLQQTQQRFGKEPLGAEPGGALTASMVLTEMDRIMQTTKLQTEMAVWALENEAHEVFVMAFSGPHRAGHMVWDETGLAVKPTDAELEQIRSAIRKTYIAADEAFGQVVAKLDEIGTRTVLTGSLHGMGPNSSPAMVLPEMLDRILHDRFDDGETKTEEKPGLLKRVRNAVPLSWRTAVKDRLPMSVQLWLTRFWRKQNVDWSQTQAIAVLDDLQGFIRFNLKGREREGILERGPEYDALCQKITQGLMTFTHSDTGQPMVSEVYRADEKFAGGAYLDEFPDLVVKWTYRPVVECTSFESPKYGKIHWPTPGRVADGRSGHHLPGGWLVAVGPGAEPGAIWGDRTTYDLIPTLHRLAGAEVPQGMAGEAIEALLVEQDAAATL